MRHAFPIVIALSLACTAIAFADEVKLSNGDVLTGTIVETTDAGVVLDHPALGKITIPKEQLATPPAAPEAPADQPPAPAVPETPPAPPEQTSAIKVFFAGWNGKLEIGFSGSDGDSDTFNLRLAGELKRENDETRLKLDTAYFLSTSSGTQTENKFTAGVRHDWLIPDSPWFFFAEGRVDIDNFAGYDWRLSGAVGPGYQFVKNEKYELLGRIGLGAYKEFGSNDNKIHPELVAGLEGLWNISANQKITGSIEVRPALDELSKVRIVSKVEYSLKLPEWDNTSLKLGVEDEYETKPSAGSSRNDVKYYGALVYEF